MPLTTLQLRDAIARLPRTLLGHYPTPLEFLPRLTAALGGPRIFIKRDDCTGLVFGGNKTRHNEFLIGDALAQGADIFVWGAGVQSNNCRQTAAACAKVGLDCLLVLGRGGPSTGPEPLQGNLLIDHLVGAQIKIVDERIGPALDIRIAEEAERQRQKGRKVYFWDKERVKPLAAVSYAICLAEIFEQSETLGIEADALYGSSAGSTGAGLEMGAAALGWNKPIRHIAPINWPWDTQADMAHIAEAAGRLVGLDLRIPPAKVDVTFDYIGPDYGKCSVDGLEALQLLARTEGILIDPMYSGKALAGLIDDVRKGRWKSGETLVFVHTGGTPALFAYAQEVSERIPARVFG